MTFKKLTLLFIIWLAPGWVLFAQNAIYVYPSAPHTPVGGIQSIVAIVTGNANKGVNWTTTCGTLIGSGNTIGLKSTSIQTCTVTATMAADGTKTATSAVTFEAIRTDLQASSTHPRIGLTPADVTDLLTKTGSGNIAYTRGLANYFANRQAYFNANFCWTGGGCGTVGPIGTLNSNGWIDGENDFHAVGGGSYEDDTRMYALMALIDPTTGNRATWAAHAHDLSMWELNEICYNASTGSGACLARSYSSGGGNSNAPFIGSQFILNNRSQSNLPPQVEAIDWNYSSFSSADKAVIAQVGHIWGQQLTGANSDDQVTSSNESVNPIGAYNSSSILSSMDAIVWSSNNYSLGHFQAMTMIGLLLDPADDPSVTSCASSTTTICASDGSAKTVGAYAVYVVKGWLRRIYAAFEDQHIVNAAYSLGDPYLCPDLYTGTIPCTGKLSGGFPAGGTGYGALSMTEMFPAVYALYTAGKLNPATDPQASFISSAYWDKLTVSLVDQLYPDVSGANGGSYTQFGSDQSFSIFAQEGYLLNEMEVYDAKYGSSWRKNIDKWYQYNVLYGGYSNFFGRFMGSVAPGSGDEADAEFPANVIQATSATNDGDFASSSPYNPTQNAYDPRNTSTLPLDFENLSSLGGLYRYYGRTDWTTTATQFQFGCNTPAQDHDMGACGRFDYLRNGEPLTTALGGTANSDGYAQAPTHQNIPGYQWNPTFDCANASTDQNICQEGGMADNSWGDYSNKVLATSSNSTYYYGATDASGAYIVNFHSGAANVTLSQREIVWLKPDQIFVYDRVASTVAGFKNFYLDLQTTPTITDNQAAMTSTSGQHLYVTSLLPGTSSLSTSALDTTHEPGAPVSALLTDTGPTGTSVRMLHTLEGKSSGSASGTSVVQSSAGTGFDGGVIGTTAVMFKRTLSDGFTSTTYLASGATTHYVADLAPNTSYPLTGAGTPSSATSDSAGVLVFAATGTGSITVGAGAPAGPSVIIGGNTLQGGFSVW